MTVSTEEVVFGGKFILIDLLKADDQDSIAAQEAARLQGFYYCGSLGFNDGEFGVQVEPYPDAVLACLRASLAFASLVTQPPKTS